MPPSLCPGLELGCPAVGGCQLALSFLPRSSSNRLHEAEEGAEPLLSAFSFQRLLSNLTALHLRVSRGPVQGGWLHATSPWGPSWDGAGDIGAASGSWGREALQGVRWGRGWLLSVNAPGLARRYFGVSYPCLEHFQAGWREGGRGPCHPMLTPRSALAGRLSLSEVQLTSARPGPGARAGWVEECTCPPGYAGRFCQSCAPGFKREIPFGSPFVSCVPCSCNQHGDCHPLTGAHPLAPRLTPPLCARVTNPGLGLSVRDAGNRL